VKPERSIHHRIPKNAACVLIFKTLQNGPTNRTNLKGLLTYRTIQFSMSSVPLSRNEKFLVTDGCCDLPLVTGSCRFRHSPLRSTDYPQLMPRWFSIS
jgi:hypothetical protein